MSHVYVIAEAGSGHTPEQMERLIEAAADADADAVKFQWTSDPALMAQRRHVPEGTYDRLGWLAPSHGDLAMAARAAGLDYMCTGYVPADIPILAPHVARFKVASFEALDTKFILAHEHYSKPVIVSTGMMSGYERDWLGPLRLFVDLRLLHCVSAYPTPREALNLAVIRRYGLDGFSDHSREVGAGAWAVLAGASIVEVHFRLEDTPTSNPDYGHSHDPAALAEYVRRVREAEVVMGDGIKKRMGVEEANVRYRVRP